MAVVALRQKFLDKPLFIHDGVMKTKTMDNRSFEMSEDDAIARLPDYMDRKFSKIRGRADFGKILFQQFQKVWCDLTGPEPDRKSLIVLLREIPMWSDQKLQG